MSDVIKIKDFKFKNEIRDCSHCCACCPYYAQKVANTPRMMSVWYSGDINEFLKGYCPYHQEKMKKYNEYLNENFSDVVLDLDELRK